MADKKTTQPLSWLGSAIASGWFRTLTLVWFIFQAIYMAVSTHLNISPDELYHYSLIKIFEKNGWLPFIHSQYGDYTPGDAVHNSFFLYHYLMSLPYHLFSGSAHAYIFLRLINIAIVVASFYFMFRLAKRLNASALVTNLSLFMLTNTLMFVFLAGMLNYDSLFLLLGLASFDMFFSLLEKPRAKVFLALLIVWLAGLMTVINFYPIAFAELIIIVYKYRKSAGESIRLLFHSWEPNYRLNNLLLLLAVLLVGLFIQRSVVDALRFHSLSPSCNHAQNAFLCKRSSNYNYSKYIDSIRPSRPVQSPITYIGSWLSYMKSRTLGIFGFKSFNETKLVGWWIYIFIFLGLAATARLYRRKDWRVLVLFAIFIFYSLLLYYDDYKFYHHTGIFGAAVQGRYWFVFLPFLYLIFNRYILELFQRRFLLNSYLVITLLVFFTAGLPSYLIKTDPSWYTSRTSGFNVKVHNKLTSLYHDL